LTGAGAGFGSTFGTASRSPWGTPIRRIRPITLDRLTWYPSVSNRRTDIWLAVNPSSQSSAATS
jgi:hypothetical protein